MLRLTRLSFSFTRNEMGSRNGTSIIVTNIKKKYRGNYFAKNESTPVLNRVEVKVLILNTISQLFRTAVC